MKKKVFMGVSLLLAVALVSACGIPQEDYDAVVADKEAAETQVASLQSDLAAAESALAAAESALAVEEENKAVMRRFWEELNKGNAAVVDELCAANYVFHTTAFGDVRGREGMKQYVSAVWTVYPDWHSTVEDMFAEGDKVATRSTSSGTHKPTGKEVTWTGIFIVRIVGGKLVEVWQEKDNLGMMQQLGFILTPGQD